MLTAEQQDAFTEIVSGAREEFSLACADEQDNHATACLEQMENLAFAAEMAEINGLTLICHELTQQLGTLEDKSQLYKLIHWTDHVLAFIRNPQDEQLAKQVVACLPESDQSKYLQLLLQQDAVNDFVIESATDTEPAFAESVLPPRPTFPVSPLSLVVDNDLIAPLDIIPPTKNDASLQEILVLELQELAKTLDSSLDHIFALTTPEHLDKLRTRYQDAVNRLTGTAHITGLQGLETLCTHILANITQLDFNWLQDHRSQTYLVFQQWPALVLIYLQEPNNDEYCLSLVNHMELEGWPVPMTEDNARHLLELLIETGSVKDTRVVEVRQAAPADMDLTLPAELDYELLDAFLFDAPSQAAELAACVGALKGNEQDFPNIAQAQRLTHTLKGAANIVGLRAIANMSHAMEDIFERLRDRPSRLDPAWHMLLQASADCVEAMIESLQGKAEAPTERYALYQQLIDALNNPSLNNNSPQNSTPALNKSIDTPNNRLEWSDDNDVGDGQPTSSPTTADSLWQTDDGTSTTPTASQNVESVRVSLNVINSLFQLAEEITIALGSTREQAQRILKKIRDAGTQEKRLQEQRFELENIVDIRAAAQRQRRQGASLTNDFDSLELDQYDDIYDVAHSLIESASDARELNREIAEQVSTLDTLLVQQFRLNKELQRLVKHTRLVPVQSMLPRLQRCIRHAARITGKMVNFRLLGAETEVNEEILDKLIDPVMHLLRNAVDHGIESAQQRVARNKPSQGEITLRFAQDGQHIAIVCEDDGAGINAEKVRARAIEKGWIKDSETLSPAQINQLLLTPGFTTKDTINQVSGRGIGMDAIYKRIRELGGTLNIENMAPKGTRFEIKVPLQLVASHALLVQLQQQWYAIPTRQLDQILPPASFPIENVGETATLKHNKQLYPVHHLGQLLGITPARESSDHWQHLPLLLTQGQQDTAALYVDAVIANQDLVVKNTGDYVKNVPGIAGVAILGDGRLVPVLDLPTLLERKRPLAYASSSLELPGNDEQQANATVLVVDDSLSIRKSLTQLVTDAGYRADSARDGVDAWEKIAQRRPAVILVDMEMPRMNGIELTSRLRSNDNTRDIPVLMITSRSSAKHRVAAEKAGITEYLTKPFTDSDLLSRIHHHLQTTGVI